jgi:hypothetical protein
MHIHLLHVCKYIYTYIYIFIPVSLFTPSNSSGTREYGKYAVELVRVEPAPARNVYDM